VTRRFYLSFLVLLWFGCGALPQAQTAPVSKNSPASANATDVTIGMSAVPLYGPWKFTVGDSPLDPATHAPVWALPSFDDSKWETMDLRPKEGATHPISGEPGYVPGWTTKGHPGYWGYGWYRIRVHLNAQPGQQLALAGPSDVDDAFEVFANGSLVGSFGDFSSKPPVVYYGQPTIFPLQAVENTTRTANAQSPSQDPSALVIAFRVWMEPNTLESSRDPGGLHGPPVFGDAKAVRFEFLVRWLQLMQAYAGAPIEAALYLLLALGAFSLIFFDRTDRVYLWIGAVFLVFAANFAVSLLGDLTTVLGIVTASVINAFLVSLALAGYVMVWWVWFGLRRPTWLPWVAAAMALPLTLATVLGEDLWFTAVPHPVSAFFHILSLFLRLVYMGLLFWVVYQGIRIHGVDGWLALPPVILSGIGRFTTELTVLGISLVMFPFGVQFTLANMASLALALVLAVLLLRRLIMSLRKQRQMALDVKQAQEVQQVILPLARMTLPGLTIESEYRPALEVGGDFFQIIPHPTDGSLLIVAGDVAGKGLKAGMLVALLVGAIRTAVRFNSDPRVVLRELNNRLIGRGDAQATCLALHIAADGAATLVNAGHLPPYLNDEPLAMEGTLPLGMVADPQLSTLCFKLKETDRLVLISDGIVEARDADGHLFGFERARNLIRTAITAADVAAAAQKFGQEDDISVISVTCTPVLEPALT